jgi:hypothetical protein
MGTHVVALETAKKLKASGFPQKSRLAYMGPLGDSEEYDLTIGSSNQFEYAAPTAQEIADQLEAAEEETLHGLTLFRYNDRISGWEAAIPAREPEDGRMFARGDTMAEALANLYLMLHNKNNEAEQANW